MKKIINKVKSILHLIKVAVNPQKNIKSVVYIGEKVASYKSSRYSANRIFENPNLQFMYRERYGLVKLDLSRLESCPDNSLGKRLAKFYTNNGLNVYPASTDTKLKRNQYLSERIRKVHDFIHIIKGYDTDLEGEAQVNAFVANQTRLPFSLLIIIFIIIKTLIKSPSRFYPLLEKIVSAWNESTKCKNFLTYRWEDKLDLPFAQVVQDFNKLEVTPTPTAANSFSFDPVFTFRNKMLQPASVFDLKHLRPAILT